MLNFKVISNFLSNIFFPQKCAFCEDISDNATVICETCKGIISDAITKKKFDFTTKKYKFAKKIIAVFEYNDFTSKGILRLKNIGDREIVEFFGEILYEEFYNNFCENEINLIIPVPMHKIKYKMKGFNHADCIANYVAYKTHIEIRKDILAKVKNNKTQHFLSEHQRRQNILGVYMVSHQEYVKNKDILIIDDVMTTGSTLCECAKVLYESGAKSVSALVIGATIEKR